MKSKSPLLAGAFTEVWERIERAPRIALFLDFDGTLAPIVPDPSQACLPPEGRRVLEVLASDPAIITAIVSGRPVADLKNRVGVSGLILAGNHGLEIEGPGLRFTEPRAVAGRAIIASLRAVLHERLKGIEGVIVEDKGLTLSVHYRMSPAEDVPAITAIVTGAVQDRLSIRTGRMVLEIVPKTDWNKGSAACWVLQRLDSREALPVSIGDDVTDEDLFRAMPEGVTVKVGDGAPTAAQCRVSGPDEVIELLRHLVTLRRGGVTAPQMLTGLYPAAANRY